MTKTTLINIGIVIAVVFIVVVVVPYVLIFASYPSLSNQWENHTWTNEQYHEKVYVNPNLEEPSPFFGMLKMFAIVGFLGLVGAGITIFIAERSEPEQNELFDRWDDQV